MQRSVPTRRPGLAILGALLGLAAAPAASAQPAQPPAQQQPAQQKPAQQKPAQQKPAQQQKPAAAKGRTMADVLVASQPSDWRALDPENTLYLELTAGRVVIELAPAFAPGHVDNIKALVRERYFDGLSINRVQDNFVVQWGDPDGKREIRAARRTLPAEFTRPLRDLPFTRLPDGDVYAPQVGFSDGFPVGRDPRLGRAWLAHCYAMVGAGRDNDADSGGGTELYVVIGHAPRQLDRNITVVGRVVWGMELLSAMPRSNAPQGFYEKPEQRVPISAVRVAADVPEAERTAIEVIRTDTPTFRALVESRRNRADEWYKVPAGKIDLCNVPIVVRPRPAPP
jgi:peptidylprolyl isomerase